MKSANKSKYVVAAVAAGAIVLAPLSASARRHHEAPGPVSATMPATTTPVAVTGVVARYYVDRAGYVTAVDITTADGTNLVRFSPSMGNQLYTDYGVGQKISLWVVGDEDTGWDAVGMGADMATMTTFPRYISTVDLLSNEPFVRAGSHMITVRGYLTDIITNRMGEPVGLVLNHHVLVRVPQEMRNYDPGAVGTDRVAQLFKGAIVEARGYPEMGLIGTRSVFNERLAATAMTINGHQAGAVSFQRMYTGRSLFNKADIAGITLNPDEVRARGLGYTVYAAPAP